MRREDGAEQPKHKIENKLQPTPEDRKIKNQPEIDRVNAENAKRTERNERKLEEEKRVKYAVEGALALVSKKLGDKSLTEKQRERLAWVAKSVKNASNNLERSSYKVEVKDGEKLLASRIEALPLEELIKETAIEIEKLKIGIRDIEQQVSLHTKAEANKLGEVEKKVEWRKVFNSIPNNGDLKKKIIAKMSAWKQVDEAKGIKYDQVKIDEQLGEACFQVLRDHTESQIKLLKQKEGEKSATVERYTKLLNTMAGASSNYFRFHYKKASRELTKIEQQTQDLYTKREANLISQDSAYRNMLLEAHGKRLPKDFNEMNKERQDYELAMLALDNRLILNLPGELEELEKVPEPEYEEVKPESIPDAPTPEPESVHKLQNTNEPYDIENLAFSIPEIPKGVDKKIFLIDISEIAKRMAWSKAEAKLTQEFDHSGGKLGKWVKNAWKGLSENYKRIKYYQEAITEIQTDNNLMRAISERVSGQPVPGGGTRVSAEYLQVLDSVVAEYKHEVADAQREVGDSLKDDPEIKGKFAELLHRYRTNKWDGAQYQGLDKRSCVELYVKENIAGFINSKENKNEAKWSKDEERLKEAKGLLYASNFYEMLESIDNQYKGQIDQAVKEVMEKNPEANIEAIREAIASHVEGVQGLDLKLGLKERDLVNNRPKGILNVYERMVNFGEKHTVLGKVVMNPFVIGAAATLAGNGVQRAIKWAAVGGAVAAGASGFWVPLGVGAIAGGAYRAFKRSKDVKYDTAQELRHQTLGGKPSEVIGVNNERNYGTAIMAFSEALAQVGAMKDKTSFTVAEKQQLAQIYARLQLEHDTLVSNKKEEFKLDLFKTDEESGKKYGTTAVEKSQLKVQLKKLGVSEVDLQALIDQEKGKLVQLISDVNKEQDSFRRKEMLKSGAMGAVMGVAGGVLAQSAINYAGEHAEKLWGGSYFKNHGTQLGAIKDWVKDSDVYKQYFTTYTHTFTHTPGTMSHARTAESLLASLKGHVSGGEVDVIHTKNWYDNPDMSDPHVHNRNELQFHISKDASEAIHFKVPVEDNNSWLIHNKTLNFADVTKAFADGRIKMIFVPDAAHPENAVVLDVDPTTKEVVIPKGSNLRALFDEKTGRPKGTGFFGLAERQGSSKNYIWINSDRNNGSTDFGSEDIKTSSMKVKIEPVLDEHPVDYNSDTIATVPPERKVFMRPEEREKFDEEKKKKEEEKARKKAEKESKKSKTKTAKTSESAEEEIKHTEKEIREHNKKLFDKKNIDKLHDAYQLDLTPEQKKSAGINLVLIDAWWKEEGKAIERAKKAQEAAKVKKVKDAKDAKARSGFGIGHGYYSHEIQSADAHGHDSHGSHGHDHGSHGHDDHKEHATETHEELVVVHESGPSIEEYLEEVAKLEASVAGVEKYYARLEEVNKTIKDIVEGKAETYGYDLDDLGDEYEELTGKRWEKGVDVSKIRKANREARRAILTDKEVGIPEAPAKAPAEKAPEAVPAKPEQSEPAKDQIPEGTFKTESDSGKESKEFGDLSEALIQSTGHRVHFNENGEQSPYEEKVKTVKVFEEALNLLPKEDRDKILGKYNSKHKDTPFARGIILGFPTSVSRLEFSRNDDTLRIPPDTTAEQLKEFLLDGYKKAIERRKARLEQRNAEGVTPSKAKPSSPLPRPTRPAERNPKKKLKIP